ncbi:MAG: glycoside hydrolase family 73 protein [Betaproteobacteria bacterium]
MKPSAFVREYYPRAKSICRAAGISTVGCLAQAALETGWGDHHPGGVWFGIKRWRQGQEATAQPTYEVIDGQRVNVEAGFVANATFEDAVRGYCDFIRSNPRYKAALLHPDDWRAYVAAVARAGYATDPEYLDKLLSIGAVIEREVYLQGLEVA